MMHSIYAPSKNHNATSTTPVCVNRAHLRVEEPPKAFGSHWHTESCQHYILAVTLQEDTCLAPRGYVVDRLGSLRHLTSNLIAIMDPQRGFADAVRPATLQKLSTRYANKAFSKIVVAGAP